MESNKKSKRSFKNNMFKKLPTEYCYIQDFENTTKKICQQCDKDNDSIYSKNMELYMKTKKQLEKKNAIFKIEGPPDPPRKPSNYDLFMIYQNRNLQTNNKIQTIAILYLLQCGYKLIIDPDVEFIPKVMNKENQLFEPYMAIDIAYSLNKDFVDDVSKYYQLNGRTLESPELLSLEEQRETMQLNNFENKYVPRPLSFVERRTQSMPCVPMPGAPIPSAPIPSAPMPGAPIPMPNAPIPMPNAPISNEKQGVHYRNSLTHYGFEGTPVTNQSNQTNYYPSLDDGVPPAYSHDNDNPDFGFSNNRQQPLESNKSDQSDITSTIGQTNEDGKINIIINKN